MEKRPKNLWKDVNFDKHQYHVTESKETDEKVVHKEDLEKRIQVYGICGECYKPGTGKEWCQSCNAKLFKENFGNWSSGNKDIDELIKQSQLNAVHVKKCLVWIPFEKFKNVVFIDRGGFSKIYSANWAEGFIYNWDIENQDWHKKTGAKVALKRLYNSSNIRTEFLSEIKSHLQLYLRDIIQCYGITQDPKTKDYMMVLEFCEYGNLRNYLDKSNQSGQYINYESKIDTLLQIARGLLDIHKAGKVHKDLHSRNILFNNLGEPYIGDLGMCQPANNEEQSKEIYGVLSYIAPEVLRGYQYTKAADIYSFGVIMNELISEEIPYHDIPHDIISVSICKGLRPRISEDTPKLLADLIKKCWHAKAEERPTAKEIYQILNNLYYKEINDENSEIYSQIKESNNKIRKNETKNSPSTKFIKTCSQIVCTTSRLFNFTNLLTECFDCQIMRYNYGSRALSPLSQTFTQDT